MPKKVREIEGCNGCPLQALYPDNSFVPARMGSGLRLAVAEAPGETEASIGEPLVGSSGAWLRGRVGENGKHIGGLYYKAGVRDEEVTYVNCIQCRPPNNCFPTDPEARSYISREDADVAVAHCKRAHLDPILRSRPWKRVDLFGAKPLKIVAGKDGGIGRWRGSPLVIPEVSDKPVAIPTLHPAAIGRDQTLIPAVINDLKKSVILAPEFYNPHPSLADVQAFDATVFAFDIETNPSTNEVLCVGLAARPFYAMCVPFKGAYLVELKRIFRNATEVIGQNNLQFDLPLLADNDVAPPAECQVWDTMLLQHLVQPDLPHGLDFIGSIFTTKPAWKHLSDEDLELYCCRDTDVTLQAYNQLRTLVKKEGLLDLYLNVQVPLAKICKLMQETGVRLNPSRIGEVREKLLAESLVHEQQLPEDLRTFKVKVNRRQPAPEGTLSLKTRKPIKFVMVEEEEEVKPWRSPDQIQDFLYNRLNLPQQVNAKSGNISTDKFALERLFRRTKLPVLQSLQRLRATDELLTTFCKEEMQHVERMHPHFNVHGTASGRLSSSDPNLQNIPESARYIYVPSFDDWEFLQVDFSGIENRLTAYFANDTERLARFTADPEFSEHKWAASMFFGYPIADVKKDNTPGSDYWKAKKVVHGVNYGMGPKKIANMYAMDFYEARELVNKWKNAIPKTSKWQEICAEAAKKDGYLTTPFGRKRWFWTQSYFTEALSFLPQSTAADIIFRAMLGLLYERVNVTAASVLRVVPIVEPLPRPARLLLQVHDSLLLEYPRVMRDEVVNAVKKVMTQGWPELGGMAVPISLEVGSSWAEMEKIS